MTWSLSSIHTYQSSLSVRVHTWEQFPQANYTCICMYTLLYIHTYWNLCIEKNITLHMFNVYLTTWHFSGFHFICIRYKHIYTKAYSQKNNACVFVLKQQVQALSRNRWSFAWWFLQQDKNSTNSQNGVYCFLRLLICCLVACTARKNSINSQNVCALLFEIVKLNCSA